MARMPRRSSPSLCLLLPAVQGQIRIARACAPSGHCAVARDALRWAERRLARARAVAKAGGAPVTGCEAILLRHTGEVVAAARREVGAACGGRS